MRFWPLCVLMNGNVLWALPGGQCACVLSGLAQSLAACVLQFHSLPSVSSAASISDQDPEYIFILIFIA